MKKKILAGILAAVTACTCAVTVVACSKDKTPEEQANVGVEQMSFGGGMKIGESMGRGIKLMSTELNPSNYGDYGVMPTADSAYTLTATISPADAANHGVDWIVSWSNASSSWATGKNATDYVTVAPNANSKIATVTCVQPFGEQIVITAKSQDNPNVKATCLVDYAQKITSAQLKFGNVSINLGGDTAIKYEIAQGVQGPGGKVEAVVQKSSVYTIVENFQYSVELSHYGPYVGTTDYFSCNDLACTGAGNYEINTEYYGKEIYFDYDHDIKDWFIMQRAGDIAFKNLTTAEIAGYLSNITNPGLYQVNFTITGTHNTYEYISQVYCSGYTNSTPVNALALDTTKYVF